MHPFRRRTMCSCVMTNRFGLDLYPKELRWAAAEGAIGQPVSSYQVPLAERLCRVGVGDQKVEDFIAWWRSISSLITDSSNDETHWAAAAVQVNWPSSPGHRRSTRTAVFRPARRACLLRSCVAPARQQSLFECHLPNLIFLDAKFPRQIFYFAKPVFPCSN
jgi:hypothetical protein